MAVATYQLKNDRTDLIVSQYGNFRIRPLELVELDLADPTQAASVTIGDYDAVSDTPTKIKPHTTP